MRQLELFYTDITYGGYNQHYYFAGVQYSNGKPIFLYYNGESKEYSLSDIELSRLEKLAKEKDI